MFSQFISNSQKNVYSTFEGFTEAFNKLEDDHYTYNFKILLPADKKSVDEDFFKMLLIKSQKAHLFAVNILSCSALEKAPYGFIREIEQQMGDKKVKVTERVLIDEDKKAILFIQLSPDNVTRLTATNQIVREGSHSYFVGKYVFEIKKETKNQQKIAPFEKELPTLVDKLKANMFKFYETTDIEKEFTSLYKKF